VQTHLDVHQEDYLSHPSEPSRIGGKTGSAAGSQLQPSKPEDKRTLRSQDGGSRLKSELSIYFQNYDDIINDAPKTPEFLSPNTPIHLVDEPIKPAKAARTETLPHQLGPTHTRRASVNGTSLHPSPQKSNAHYNGATPIDFTTLLPHASSITVDPLADGYYLKAHRRAERKEKQLRNIEKERAQHEKVQLERLLDGLQGPDWLKVMGVTGVTDGDRKLWEPKRQYFVREVDALVDKFRIWKEEEKRLRLEKEERLAREEENYDEDSEAGAEDDGLDSDTDAAPPSSDMDAWAARQLQQEAKASLTKRPGSGAKRKANALEPLLPLAPDKPFRSFFDKPHLRAQALGKQRHGRNTLAFGKPVPQMGRRDFELPVDMLTEDAVRANARKRRRMRRETKG